MKSVKFNIQSQLSKLRETKKQRNVLLPRTTNPTEGDSGGIDMREGDSAGIDMREGDSGTAAFRMVGSTPVDGGTAPISFGNIALPNYDGSIQTPFGYTNCFFEIVPTGDSGRSGDGRFIDVLEEIHGASGDSSESIRYQTTYISAYQNILVGSNENPPQNFCYVDPQGSSGYSQYIYTYLTKMQGEFANTQSISTSSEVTPYSDKRIPYSLSVTIPLEELLFPGSSGEAYSVRRIPLGEGSSGEGSSGEGSSGEGSSGEGSSGGVEFAFQIGVVQALVGNNCGNYSIVQNNSFMYTGVSVNGEFNDSICAVPCQPVCPATSYSGYNPECNLTGSNFPAYYPTFNFLGIIVTPKFADFKYSFRILLKQETVPIGDGLPPKANLLAIVERIPVVTPPTTFGKYQINPYILTGFLPNSYLQQFAYCTTGNSKTGSCDTKDIRYQGITLPTLNTQCWYNTNSLTTNQNGSCCQDTQSFNSNDYVNNVWGVQVEYKSNVPQYTNLTFEQPVLFYVDNTYVVTLIPNTQNSIFENSSMGDSGASGNEKYFNTIQEIYDASSGAGASGFNRTLPEKFGQLSINGLEDAKYSYKILGPIRRKIELPGIIYHVAGWEMEFIKENDDGPLWKMKDKAAVNITYLAEE